MCLRSDSGGCGCHVFLNHSTGNQAFIILCRVCQANQVMESVPTSWHSTPPTHIHLYIVLQIPDQIPLLTHLNQLQRLIWFWLHQASAHPFRSRPLKWKTCVPEVQAALHCRVSYFKWISVPVCLDIIKLHTWNWHIYSYRGGEAENVCLVALLSASFILLVIMKRYLLDD